MDSQTNAFPSPRLTDWNRPYFDGAAAGTLVLQRCSRCGKLIYYPRMACPSCLSTDVTWETIDGQGSIYSYSIVWRPQHPSFEPHVPIIMVAVQLNIGLLMIANLVHCDPERVEIGKPVEVCFSALDGGPTLPRFRMTA